MRSAAAAMVVVFAALLLLPDVAAAQDEGGETLQTAGVPTGPTGQIGGVLSDINDVDLFRICLSGGGGFSATAATDFDPFLWLFDSTGGAVYANDDANGLQSELPAGNSLTPGTPGVYYLAVSSYFNEPFGAEGPGPGYLFRGPTNTESGFDVWSPTTAGDTLQGWDDFGGSSGAYGLTLTDGIVCAPPAGSATAVCIESDFVQTQAAAAGAALGHHFTGSDNVRYMIISGAPTCRYDCSEGQDIDCDGKLGDFCDPALNRHLVANVHPCLGITKALVSPAAATAEPAAVPIATTPSALAYTGSETTVLGNLGLALLAAGSAAVALSVRRCRTLT